MKDQGKRIERLEAAFGEGDEPFTVELVRGPSVTKEEAMAMRDNAPLPRGAKVTRIELVGVRATPPDACDDFR
ncbi:MAG TPA: hypothetical protein PLQ12_11680 [Candidatus Defluviicoccus seviourii]|nr:hypothetical protein [Candidatus Defluviicoccus seviourii]